MPSKVKLGQIKETKPRFSNSKEQLLVGPGSYFADPSPLVKGKGHANSVFQSKIKRDMISDS